MMKDILIIGLVGVLWELLPSNGGELITVVLFLLLMVATIARTPRSNDIVVICGVGLLSELVLADGRNGVTWRGEKRATGAPDVVAGIVPWMPAHFVDGQPLYREALLRRRVAAQRRGHRSALWQIPRTATL